MVSLSVGTFSEFLQPHSLFERDRSSAYPVTSSGLRCSMFWMSVPMSATGR